MHSAHTPTRGTGTWRAHQKTSPLGYEAWGPVSLVQSLRDHTQRGQGPRRPRRAQDARRSPVLAPHNLVLVHDELVYIFQIKLVRHGAAALGPAASRLPTPSQPQLPPAGNVFPPPRSRVVSHGNGGDALRRPCEGQTSLRDGAGRSGRGYGSGRKRGTGRAGVVWRRCARSPGFKSYLGRLGTDPGQNT